MAVVINGTSGITSVNGSAAAPSVTGTDTDTGLVYGTNTLSLVTGGTTAVTIGSDQSTTLAGTLVVQSQNMTPYTGFKNRIINGAMVVNQRATSRALTSTEEYVVDRWAGCSYGGNTVTFAQSTSIYPTGYAYSFGATNSGTTAAGTSSYYGFRQKIEGFNGIDLAFGTASASSITISFWARSSVTGTYTVGLLNGALNRANRNTFTINSANTWEQKTVTFAGDTTGTWATGNTTFMYVDIVLSAGSSSNDTANTWTANTKESTSSATNTWCATNGATFYITGVQLEKGPTATSFDYRPFGLELDLCQRYFEKSFDYTTAPAHNTGGLPVIPIGSSLGCGGNAYWTIPFKTCKRTNTYTIRWYDPIGAHTASENWVRVITTCDSGSAFGPNNYMQFNALTTNHMAGYSQVGTSVPPIFYWTADAEL